MPAEIIPASRFLPALREALKARIAALPVRPHLHIVRVGSDAASGVYIKHKQKAAADLGLACSVKHFTESPTAEALKSHLELANEDPTISGIILQLPLPEALYEKKQALLNIIAPEKDVDGLTATNQRLLAEAAKPHHTPATPKGMMRYLAEMGQSLEGKRVAVLGRSALVGAPFARLCQQAGADVAVLHSQTPKADYAAALAEADIVASCVGQPNLVRGEQLKPGCVFIDVGINRLPNGTLAGDGHTESIDAVASIRTPVPGGVGPFTVFALMENVMEAATKAAGE